MQRYGQGENETVILKLMIYFKEIRAYLTKRYNLLADPRIKRILCFGTPIYIFVFLLIFQPFNLNLTHDLVKKIWAIFLFSSSGSVIWVLHLYGIFNKKKDFSIGSTIILIVWIHIFMGITSYVISERFFNHNPFYLLYLLLFIFWVSISGIIPIAFTIVIYKIYNIRSKVKFINQVNKIVVEQNATEKSEIITINANIGQDYFIIPLNHLLFLQAAGNYVDVHYFDNDYNLKHGLIRNTLSGVILQLSKQCSSFIRCHHSYVVNLNKVERVIGNSSGYKAVLKNSQTEIPISKKYKDQFLSSTYSA